MNDPRVQALRATHPGVNLGWGEREYTNWWDEQLSWKTSCYVGDWSFLSEIVVEGPDALKVFQDTSVNSFEKFDLHQGKHIIQCDPNGNVVAEGVLLRLGEDKFITQSTPVFRTTYALEHGDYDATWRPVERFQLQVSGPSALAVCEKLAGESLRGVKFIHFAEITVAGHPVWALRLGMAGELGFELHGAMEHKAEVLAAILEAGAEYGIRRLGSKTVMINHLEAAFPTGTWHYLNAIWSFPGYHEWMDEVSGSMVNVIALRGSLEGMLEDYYQTPYALGWGRNVRFDHDFVGREALEREAEQPRRARVTLEFDDADVIDIFASYFGEGQPHDFLEFPHQERWYCWADAVLGDGDRIIGTSTVPGYSAWFKKVLTLAYVEPRFAEPGTRVQVLWGNPGTNQKVIGATVRPAPYKEDHRYDDLRQAVAHPA